MALRFLGPQSKSPPYQVLWSRHCGSGDIIVLVQDHVMKWSLTLWIGTQQDKFGGNNHSGSGLLLVT